MPRDPIEPELAGPLLAWKRDFHPDHAANLLKAVHPILERGVSLYGGGQSNPLAMSRARQIALKALRGYDPTQKTSVRTHLLNHLKGLQRYSAQAAQGLSVPEQVTLDRMHLVDAENELRDRLGRDPSDQELGDHTGLSPKRLAYVRGYRPAQAEGQLAALTRTEESEGLEPAVARDPWRERAEFLYHDLSPQDQVILEYGLGLRGSPKLSTSEIAQRLNITPGAVSQRAAKIQAALDELEQSELF